LSKVPIKLTLKKETTSEEEAFSSSFQLEEVRKELPKVKAARNFHENAKKWC